MSSKNIQSYYNHWGHCIFRVDRIYEWDCILGNTIRLPSSVNHLAFEHTIHGKLLSYNSRDPGRKKRDIPPRTGKASFEMDPE